MGKNDLITISKPVTAGQTTKRSHGGTGRDRTHRLTSRALAYEKRRG